MAVRENPKGNKEIQESREMSEVVFMKFSRNISLVISKDKLLKRNSIEKE